MAADKVAREMIKKKLLKRHPYIDLNQFKILTHIDGDAKAHPEVVFPSSGREIDVPIEKLYAGSNPLGQKAMVAMKPKPSFPKIWMPGGTIQKMQTSKHWKREVYPKYDFSKYTYLEDDDVIDYNVWDFKVFVDQKNWFKSRLKPIDVVIEDRSVADSWVDDRAYYKMIFATYVASYMTGISREHLSHSSDVHPVITSLMRYALYYTISVILRRLETEKMSDLSREYDAGGVYKKMRFIPREKQYLAQPHPSFKTTHTVHEWLWTLNRTPPPDVHYKLFIMKKSNGFTAFGLKVLNNAIASFCYSILGSQARLRTAIVNKGAISLQCQDVFRQLVSDTIVNHDTTVGVSNMRKSISDCNQTVNLAVSPSTFLLPSDMKILKERIPGYSNVLYRADEKAMKFGVNTSVNFSKSKLVVKKHHQDSTPSGHLDTLGGSTYGEHGSMSHVSPLKHGPVLKARRAPREITSEPLEGSGLPQRPSLGYLLLLSGLGSLLISKYVL